jgi:hypothetical protein
MRCFSITTRCPLLPDRVWRVLLLLAVDDRLAALLLSLFGGGWIDDFCGGLPAAPFSPALTQRHQQPQFQSIGPIVSPLAAPVQ